VDEDDGTLAEALAASISRFSRSEIEAALSTCLSSCWVGFGETVVLMSSSSVGSAASSTIVGAGAVCVVRMGDSGCRGARSRGRRSLESAETLAQSLVV
jgi:hypothetical protein